MREPILFYFDYISPYAYLASTQLPALAARHGLEIRAVPVLFAAMLDASGSRGPAEIPLKREYMFRDVNRLAKMLGVTIEPPATHPFHPLAALRMSHAADDWRLVEALYRATWVDARRVDQPEVVIEVANEVGLDGKALFERAQSADIKARVRAVTDEAIGRGAFGVPTMIVDDELFWGVDSLPLLERFLSTGERVDVSRWRAIAASATRKA
jgi:2-hydroxychromene-2-carboxylate isomerase